MASNVATDWGFVLAEVVPLALAIAASPFAIVPAILLLFTERPRATGGAFLAGWLLGLTVVTTAAALLTSVLEAIDGSSAWLTWARIVAGVLLLALAVRKLMRRGTVTAPPPWIASVSSATPSRAFVLAVVMSVANPKILVLAGAAGVIIGTADLDRSATALAVVITVVVAAISVAVPVLLYLVLGQRVLRPLGRARDWLLRNNAIVMAVVFLILGVALLREGISGLW